MSEEETENVLKAIEQSVSKDASRLTRSGAERVLNEIKKVALERKDKRHKNNRDNGEEKTSRTINGMTCLASEGTMEKRTETCIEMISNSVSGSRQWNRRTKDSRSSRVSYNG